MENTPSKNLYQNHIWDLVGIFSITWLVKISITLQLTGLPYKFVGVWSKHLLIFLKSLQQSSVIFDILSIGNLLNFSEIFVPNFHVAFCRFSENLWKSGQKFSENCQKCGYQYDYITNKIINGCKLVGMEYLFSCSALYLTHKILNWRLKRYMYSISIPA